MLRLAGHDFMDFRTYMEEDGTVKTSGGSDGCVNFEDADNTGLPQCLAHFDFKKEFHQTCHRVSLADFFVIAGESVVSRVHSSYNKDDVYAEGTLAARFRDQFLFGRKTSETCDDLGLMPNPEEGCGDLKRIFVDHIFFDVDPWTSWRYTTAISGAHTIGKMNPHNSGYDGHWSRTPGKFDNDYYLAMVDQGWGPIRNIGGNKKKNGWRVVDKGRDNEISKKQLYLDTDLCLVYDNNLDSV